MTLLQGCEAIIPRPLVAVATGGSWRLPAAPSVAAADPALAGLARLLADDLRAAAGGGLDPQVAAGAAGDLVLALDPALPAEGYRLEVAAAGARIAGGSPTGVCWGMSTLLQALTVDHAARLLPCLRIEDAPRFGHRGLMIDVARHPHTLVTLMKAVELCRWYKLRFLQLHLADVEGCAFPSAAFPGLATPGRALAIDEWRELEAFAARRQVVIIPEFDVPGHACPGLRTLCPTSPRGAQAVINPVAESTFTVLGTIIDELLAAFPRTPFVHIGADEVDYDGWRRCADCAAFLRVHRLERIEEVYRHFIVRMRDLVAARGRRMAVWEGFAAEGAIAIPPDIIVQFFDVEYLVPERARALGHEVVNSCWGPLYVVPGAPSHPLEMVHRWHPGLFGGNALACVPDALDAAPAFAACDRHQRFHDRPLPGLKHPFAVAAPVDDPGLLGGMLCSWEMVDGDEIPALRRRAAALAERTWNPAHEGGFLPFLHRLETQDYRLDRLLHAVVRANRHRLPDFGAVGRQYGPFVTELEVAWPRDDGPVGAIAAPPADLAGALRRFTGDFCDLHGELRARGRGTAWFVHRFEAAADGALAVLLGYDGPVRVWLDDAVVFTDPAGMAPARRDTAAIPLQVRRGPHRLAVALDADGGRAWGIFLRLRREAGAWPAAAVIQPER